MLLMAVAAGSMAQAEQGAHKEGWVLVFEDDFDGDSLDQTKWNLLPIGAPVAPRKDGYWAHEAVFLDGEGHLVIRTFERDGAYYTGGVNTLGKFEQAYGYYEIRAQLPKEPGFWAAFWLMTDGVHRVGDQGRDGTEIDIFESPYASADTIHHALHWDGYGESHRSVGRDVHIPGIYDGFHVFAVEWNEEEYIFYVDGVETWRTSAGGVSRVPSFLKVTAEVGTWAGDIRQARLPADFIVDYVRVYARDHKIEIDAPPRDAVVAADAPVRFRIAPDVAVKEVRVVQNGTEIYRGAAVPDELTLALPVQDAEEEHRLTVTVLDAEGREHERSVRFRVQQLKLDIPFAVGSRVREVIDVRAAAGFAAGEQISEARLVLRPVQPGEETGGAGTVLYEGAGLPAVSWDTRTFADGAYDLVLLVRTDKGRTLEVQERILVDNWEVLEEPFNAPIAFFEMQVDSLLAVERSPGWHHVTERPAAFFGDDGRLAAQGLGDHVLVWRLPRLRSFELEVYVHDEADAELLRFAAAAEGGEWRELTGRVSVEERSPEGWLRLRIYGTVPDAWEADLFRLTYAPQEEANAPLQLGRLLLRGQK